MTTIQEKYMKIVCDVKEVAYGARKITIYKYGICALLLFFVTILSTVPHFFKNESKAPRVTFPTDMKYVYFWTLPKKEKGEISRFQQEEPKFPTGQQLFIEQKCPFINCFITYNRTLLKNEENFDAVVFDISQLSHWKHQHPINISRSPFQKYIFKSLESSENTPLCYDYYEDFFNWTWTYKLDSDIQNPFIGVYQIDSNVSTKRIGPNRNINWLNNKKHVRKALNKVKSKNKAVAWIPGTCKLKKKHSDFIEELKNELEGYNYTLDTFGPCGDIKCPENKIHKCFKKIEDEYFFQLVLEESSAEDYVTEKLAKVLTHVMIPIVRNKVVDYNRFMAPGTYIDAMEHDIKKLGAIINYLMRNRLMYAHFLDWMNHYVYTTRPRNYVCDLCTKLNDIGSFHDHKSHSNIRLWWHKQYKDTCPSIDLYYKFIGKETL